MRTPVTIAFLLYLLMAATSTGSAQNFWERISAPKSAHVTSLAVMSSNVIFAGTERGILRSTDKGESWEESGPANVVVNSLVVAPNGYVFAVTDSPWVWRSTDSGSSWHGIEILNSSLERCRVFSLACNGIGELIATTEAPQVDAIYRSTDYGQHWTWQFTTSSPSFGSPGHVVLEDSGHVFVGPISWNRLAISTDHGASWYARPLPNLSNAASLAMNSRGHLFVGGLGNVVRSTDNGLYWTSATSGLAGLAVLAIAAGSGDTMFAATYPGGVVRSTDNGSTWTPTALGHTMAAIAMDRVGTLFAGGVSIFRSSNCGNHWSMLEAGWQDVNVNSLVANRGDTLYAVGGGEGIFSSTDQGVSWSELLTDLRNERLVGDLAISPHGHLFVALSVSIGRQYFRSTDRGKHWVGLDPGPISSLVFNDSGHIFTMFRPFLFEERWGRSRVLRSTNDGDTWDTVNTGLPSEITGPLIINRRGDLFVGTDQGIYRSTNRGALWTAVNNGLADKRVHRLAVSRRGDLFAATGTEYADSVFRSTDNGENWLLQFPLPHNTRMRTMAADAGGKVFVALDSMGVLCDGVACSSGLTDPEVGLLSLDNGGYLYAATGSGIFRSALSTALEELPSGLPATFRLEQNYPNPFNPKTVVRSWLPVASHVKLAVYDVLGREVATLVNEKRAAGRYQDFFDGSGLASGAYIYRLTAGQFIESRKMILAK